MASENPLHVALKFATPPPPAQDPDIVFANALGDFVAAWAKKNPQQAINIVLLVGAGALAFSLLAALNETRG